MFVGDLADVVDLPLGPDLPNVREWTKEHFEFTGYVMGERPDPAERTALRARLGYADEERGLPGQRRRLRGRRATC